jgi:hypothetical protein
MTLHATSATELTARLRAERVVPVTADVWSTLATEFEEIERHATGMAGDLIVIRTAGGLAAVEQPSATQRVVRRLTSSDEARQFVRLRMEQYERMWDGCGCKVDYYADGPGSADHGRVA